MVWIGVWNTLYTMWTGYKGGTVFLYIFLIWLLLILVIYLLYGYGFDFFFTAPPVLCERVYRQKEKRIDFSILFPCNYYSRRRTFIYRQGRCLYNLFGYGLLLCTVRFSCRGLFCFLYWFGFYFFLLGSLFFFLLYRLGLRVSCKKGTK